MYLYTYISQNKAENDDKMNSESADQDGDEMKCQVIPQYSFYTQMLNGQFHYHILPGQDSVVVVTRPSSDVETRGGTQSLFSFLGRRDSFHDLCLEEGTKDIIS